METKVHVHFKVAHVPKASVMGLLNTTKDSSPCNSTPMNLQSARDRLLRERGCSADAKREQEGRRSEQTKVR